MKSKSMPRKKGKLSPTMTVEQLDSGYWYVEEIREFAKEIGIPSSTKLRKDELEKAIKVFLRTGKKRLPTRRNLSKSQAKDSDAPLNMKRRVVNFTNNKVTKDWIVTQAKKMDASFKERSGARLRINRWREDQLTKGKPITYGDLVKKFVEINKPNKIYKKYPSGRYINFLSEYLSNEKNSNRKKAIAAWHSLKKLDIPKTYIAWKKYAKSI